MTRAETGASTGCRWTRHALTPCVLRYGEMCYAPHRDDPERQCVGCGAPPEAIAQEQARQGQGARACPAALVNTSFTSVRS
jgi:hypothetical protein